MQNFTWNLNTRIRFGRDAIAHLAEELAPFSERILLVTGGGSIRRNGVHEATLAQLEKRGASVVEVSGVQPNPRIASVREGVRLAREHRAGFVLAVGGGSVLDAAKTIAAGVAYQGDPWDFFTGRAAVGEVLPVGTVLTLAATGSEMNGNSVISNPETTEKLAIGVESLRPKFSILDPVYTFSVPADQTAAGSADIASHVFEQYFSREPGTFVQDRLAEGVLQTVVRYAPLAIERPDHYEARANLLWAGTLALNGLLAFGRPGDWATHMIEHEVSAHTDLTHGTGLAILHPAWMEEALSAETAEKFSTLAERVWGLSGADRLVLGRSGIEAWRRFFTSLGLPEKLSQTGVLEKDLGMMAERLAASGPHGHFVPLDREAILRILKRAW
jgi:alcohol dehydrogenase YqhD (iron-dependent ADH family)